MTEPPTRPDERPDERPDGPGDVARRKRLGAWYTPDALVEHLVSLAIDGMPRRRRLRVLDPACGDGRFLAAVSARWRGAVELTGVDVDDEAVAATRRALPVAEVLHADALALDWEGRTFDLVIGNPPFLSQMASATTRGGRSRFGGGPYADAAAEFLALATDLARRDRGRVAFVLPQSLLATRDASAIRADVERRAAVRHCWWADRRMFDAHVHTCALVLERSTAQVAVTRSHGATFAPAAPAPWSGSWASMLLDDPSAALAIGAAGDGRPVLGDLATFAVDFRDQYYGLVGAVGDHHDGPPFITSGLIEPGRVLWGERPVRFAKQRFDAPRVELSMLSPRMRDWAQRRLVPKILIANQTRVIEAVHDPVGAWLPGVPVITCTTDRPEQVLAVLTSDPALAWVRHHAAGTGLSADTVRLTPSLLASIPMPG